MREAWDRQSWEIGFGRSRRATAVRSLLVTGCLLVSPVAGCGEQDSAARISAPGSVADTAAKSPASAASAPAESTPAQNAADAETRPVMPRRIIYNAQVTLVVESLTTVAQEITQLVQTSGGYISETNTEFQTKERRVGTWKVRVPVDRFDRLLTDLGKLGELQQTHVESQDVSQEYYDLEARISSKQQEEKRLLKHLDDSTGKLEEILAVEREISRVRGEVEQMQGRHRFLTNQTAFSTITISVTELQDYTPPVSPTLATEVARTFRGSVDSLAALGRWVLLVAVALAPWVPVLALLAALAWWIARRLGIGRDLPAQESGAR